MSKVSLALVSDACALGVPEEESDSASGGEPVEPENCLVSVTMQYPEEQNVLSRCLHMEAVKVHVANGRHLLALPSFSFPRAPTRRHQTIVHAWSYSDLVIRGGDNTRICQCRGSFDMTPALSGLLQSQKGLVSHHKTYYSLRFCFINLQAAVTFDSRSYS